MAKLPMFSEEVNKVLGFLTVCKLFIRIKMRNYSVEEQIQQMLSYVQKRPANIWKKNVMQDLQSGSLSYVTIEEFLSSLKKEFGKRDDKTMKVVELQKSLRGK